MDCTERWETLLGQQVLHNCDTMSTLSPAAALAQATKLLAASAGRTPLPTGTSFRQGVPHAPPSGPDRDE
jgi:hypothetical protein